MDEIPTQSSTEPPPTPVVPLDYSPGERRSATPAIVSFLRRFALATGLSFMAGAIGMIMFPQKDEVVGLFCVGLGLVLLAIPLPKLPGW